MNSTLVLSILAHFKTSMQLRYIFWAYYNIFQCRRCYNIITSIHTNNTFLCYFISRFKLFSTQIPNGNLHQPDQRTTPRANQRPIQQQLRGSLSIRNCSINLPWHFHVLLIIELLESSVPCGHTLPIHSANSVIYIASITPLHIPIAGVHLFTTTLSIHTVVFATLNMLSKYILNLEASSLRNSCLDE